MELLKAHRTVRKYLSKDIAQSVLRDILDCGVRASNTGNMQLYCAVVTKDQLKKEALAPLHFNQPMVKSAPVVVTICLDFNRFYKWCRINSAKTDFDNLLWLLNGTIDASLFAQNICIAAESHGIGICYLGTALYNAPEIAEVLKLPSGVIPVTTLTLGYPETLPELTDRLPMEAVVHFEEYSDFSDEQIMNMYSEKEKLNSSKHFVLENRKENLAQVYAEVRYKTSDSLYFSSKLKKMLCDQGFQL